MQIWKQNAHNDFDTMLDEKLCRCTFGATWWTNYVTSICSDNRELPRAGCVLIKYEGCPDTQIRLEKDL